MQQKSQPNQSEDIVGTKSDGDGSASPSDASSSSAASSSVAPTAMTPSAVGPAAATTLSRREPTWQLTKEQIFLAVAVLVALRLLIFALCTSDHQEHYFRPFVKHFIQFGANPWDTFPPQTESPFPYQPLMLWLFAIPFAPVVWLGQANSLLGSIVFRLPILVADLGVLAMMLRMYPLQAKQVLILYGLAPIVMYSSYMHGQLDLVPTAFSLASFYFLSKRRNLLSGLALGLGLATKLHLLASMPLMAIFIFKTKGWKSTIEWLVASFTTYLLFAAPYISSSGFQNLVLFNRLQFGVFKSPVMVGDVPVHLPLLAIALCLGRFFMYPKVNLDLLKSYLTIIYATFVLLVPPAPGWYVWLTPFMILSILDIRQSESRKVANLSYWALSTAYFAYFAFFHIYPYVDVLVGGQPLFPKAHSESLQSLSFTGLEAMLVGLLIICYRAGVKSNQIYRVQGPTMIGIGGDSGCGKSTLMGDLREMFGTRLLDIEGDGDHKWERGDPNWSDFTHLNPKANYLHRQADDLLALKQGSAVIRQDYDHTSGRFTEGKALRPKEYVVISGLLPFYLPKMRKLIDLKIYMDPDESLKMHWKMQRDTQERGHSSENVIAQIKGREKDMLRFIKPQRDYADLIIHLFPLSKDVLPDAGNWSGELLGIELTFDSSVHVESLVNLLKEHGHEFEWDYSTDLKTQYMRLVSPVAPETLSQIAGTLLPNMDELLDGEIKWANGYRGLTQLVVLIVVSDLLQQRG